MRHVIRTGQIEIARWSRGRFPCANKDARPWPSPSTPSRCRRNSRWSRHLAPGRKMFALRPHPQQRPHPRVVSCFWQWFRVSLNRWLINWSPQRLGLLTFNLILASGLPFQLCWIPLEHGTEIFRHLCGLEFHFQFACSQFLFIVFFFFIFLARVRCLDLDKRFVKIDIFGASAHNYQWNFLLRVRSMLATWRHSTWRLTLRRCRDTSQECDGASDLGLPKGTLEISRAHSNVYPTIPYK